MREIEQLDKLILEVLMKEGNFSLAYNQILINEEMQKKFEEHTKINWRYCGIIAAYSGTAFNDLNPCLRSKNYICNRKYINIFSELLSEAINQLEQVNSYELCRNESHVFPKIVSEWLIQHIGRKVQYPSFTSTSLNWQPVESRIMFKIQTKEKDSKARNIIPILEIFQPERATNENEILFDKETTFMILKEDNGIIYLEESDKDDETLILTNSYWEFDDDQLLVN